jgi:DNA-binding transcriptional MerR regulator
MAAQAQLMDETPKGYYRIGEVSRLTGTKAFVLRYWETEFPMLRPIKTPSGHRLYSRRDIETVFEIKRLLYDEGFTIAGARRFLAGESAETSAEPYKPQKAPSSAANIDRRLLIELRDELRAILALVRHS